MNRDPCYTCFGRSADDELEHSISASCVTTMRSTCSEPSYALLRKGPSSILIPLLRKVVYLGLGAAVEAAVRQKDQRSLQINGSRSNLSCDGKVLFRRGVRLYVSAWTTQL